jgi:hypothetical protein
MNLRFTSSALIAPMLHSAAGLQALWTDRESFVAFPYLSLDVAIAIRPRLFPGAGLGCVIPAMNFDPPEDRPNEPEFGYVDILINDFSDLNDDIGTLSGVSTGSHLRQQLEWQPKINTEVTHSLAIVAPGPLAQNRGEGKRRNPRTGARSCRAGLRCDCDPVQSGRR